MNDDNPDSITLPYKYTPRSYQIPLFEAIDSGIKRLIQVWHRRAGKDITDLSLVTKKMYERVGAYYYFFPTYAQGKKILWDGLDNDGGKFLDRIPRELRVKTNETEMKIELDNGSIFQIIGTDNIDSIVGTNPVGCVFSEFSLQDPTAWDFVRPILAGNGGWALFNWTPRGENHAYDLHMMAERQNARRLKEGKKPLWFISVLTVDDTGVIPEEVLEQEREETIAKNGDDAVYQQEYYVSYSAAISGTYYGNLMKIAKEEGRIGFVPHNPLLPVYTAWDLGKGANNAVWFWQVEGKKIRFIDFYKGGIARSIPQYIAEIKEKNYVFARHYAPHDLEDNGDISTEKTRMQIARELGFEFTILPKLPVADGIDMVKNLLPRCHFDEEKCKYGINALRSYGHEYDEVRKLYKENPAHNWASHPADAFRYFAMAFSDNDDYDDPNGGWYEQEVRSDDSW